MRLKTFLPAFLAAGILSVGAEQVVFEENFENPAHAARWKMTGGQIDPKRYALSRFLTVGGKKQLSLQDFDWGGDPMKTTAATPEFSPCAAWRVEFDFSFTPGHAAKRSNYTANVLLLDGEGGVIWDLPIHYVSTVPGGKLLGELPVEDGRSYRLRLTMAHNDQLAEVTLTDPATGKEEILRDRKPAKHTPLTRLRFEAVSGWENMGVLNIGNLVVTNLGAPVERVRESIGSLENDRMKLSFTAAGETELSCREEGGGWSKLGLLGAPELPGGTAAAKFRAVKLRNDNPSRPRVDYQQIASATEVAGSGGQVFGVAALDSTGKQLYLLQWTLFPEAARLRIYPEGEVPSGWGENLVALPFRPAAGTTEQVRFAPERQYLHRTGGEPESAGRGQVIEFTNGRSSAAIAVNGEMPTWWQFYRKGKLYCEMKQVSLPWATDFACGTIAVSVRGDGGARRREAIARAGDERLLLEVESPDPFFLIAEPGPWRLTARIGNYFRKPQRIDLRYRIVDFDGKVLADETVSQVVPPGGEWSLPVAVRLDRQGPVYAEFHASHEFAGDFRRVCGGLLPEHRFRAGGESRIGMAAFRGDVGPHTEYRSPEAMLRLMKRIGVSLIRQPAGNDASAHALGIRTWYANDLNAAEAKRYFDGEPSWMNDPEKRREWLRGNLERTRKNGSEVFEFSNEWNLSGGEQRAVRAARYAEEWLPPLRELRDEAFPEIRLGGLSIANGDLPFMQAVYDRGGWKNFDYLVFHASGVPRSPELGNNYWSYMKTLETIREALRRFEEKPLYISELYAPAAPNLSISNNERTAADDLALEIALAVALDVKNVMLYCFDDFDRPNLSGKRFPEPLERERHFGLIRRDWVPKATLWSYATAARFFDPGDFLGDLKFDDRAIKGMLFDRGPNGRFALLWSRRDGLRDHEVATPQTFHRAPWIPTGVTPPVELKLRAAGREIIVTDVVGRSRKLTPGPSGDVAIQLTESPVYVEGAALTSEEGEFFRKLSPKYHIRKTEP